MTSLILSGCSGRMGHVLEALCQDSPEFRVVAGFDLHRAEQRDFPTYTVPSEFTGSADAVIDFSNAAALTPLLRFCVGRKIPVVLATTGYSPAQLEEIAAAAEKIPVFRSANMSLGINVLLDLVRKAASVLGGDYDIEIVERHHNKKVDAPSGTALMLADAAASVLPVQPEYVYERQSRRQPRGVCEIGISSVRGGNIVGDHTVIFAGRNEVIEIKHSAMSREVFASGALKAAQFLAAVTRPGQYSMADLVAQETARGD